MSFLSKRFLEQFTRLRAAIEKYVTNTSLFLSDALNQGKKVLFEGAQGAMLDVDHGTYPFVTSSNTVSAQAAIGSGVGPKYLNRVLGISKAYTTRVGSGPLPSELKTIWETICAKKGGEYGGNYRAPARCGWFDLVAARHSIRINGLTHLALTKLDVLSGNEINQSLYRYRVIKIPFGQKYPLMSVFLKLRASLRRA